MCVDGWVVISVCGWVGVGVRLIHLPLTGILLTSFSEPSLLVKAASLKQIIQTAFNLITLSARGIRFNTGPNG